MFRSCTFQTTKLSNIQVYKYVFNNPFLKDSFKNFEKSLVHEIFLRSEISLRYVNGFCPLQLVTGRQPRLPGATSDNLAGLGEEHEETRGISRISSLQKARKAFMEVENLARLKNALAARPTKKELYRLGEKVFFKYGTDNKWHGPGRIVAIDNKGIYIKHGRVVIHTSEPRVTKTALGTRFDDKREVPREQDPTYENGSTRRQESAAKSTVNTADDDDNDLELEVVLGTQNTPSTGHETDEHDVEGAQEDLRGNEEPDTSSIEAVREARNQGRSLDPERDCTEPNLDTSRFSAQSDQDNQSNRDQSDLEAELPKDSYDDEKSEIEVAKKMMRLGTETEIPERLEKAGKKAGTLRGWGRRVRRKLEKSPAE